MHPVLVALAARGAVALVKHALRQRSDAARIQNPAPDGGCTAPPATVTTAPPLAMPERIGPISPSPPTYLPAGQGPDYNGGWRPGNAPNYNPGRQW
jgi:hypothetical protein